MKLKASGGVADVAAAGALFPVPLRGLAPKDGLAEAPGAGSGLW